MSDTQRLSDDTFIVFETVNDPDSVGPGQEYTVIVKRGQPIALDESETSHLREVLAEREDQRQNSLKELFAVFKRIKDSSQKER